MLNFMPIVYVHGKFKPTNENYDEICRNLIFQTALRMQIKNNLHGDSTEKGLLPAVVAVKNV